jgi:O-antigen/teichoic acid export membrane protein
MFRRLVAFGGGMFMITIASLLLTATQTAMTTRYLGLTSAAVWATAPKVFMLAQQVVCKLWDYRVPYLSSLMSEERRAQLSKEYINLFGIIAYIAGATTGVLAAINPAFLELWTAGQIKWEPINNFLMAVFVYNYLIVRCFSDFVLHTKKIGWMPLLMCCEGVLFVLLASLLMPRYGLSGMLFAALIIGILQLPYAWKCFSAYLASDAPALSSLLKKVLGGACCGGILWGMLTLTVICIPSHPPWLTLLLQFLVAKAIGAPLALKLLASLKKAK